MPDYRGCQITEVVRLQRLSDYRGCRIIKGFLVQSNMIPVPQDMVRLKRMSDYRGCQIIQCFLVQSNMVIVSHEMVRLERCWIIEVGELWSDSLSLHLCGECECTVKPL